MSKKDQLKSEGFPNQRRAGRPPKQANRTQVLNEPPIDRRSFIDSLWLTIPTRMPPLLLEAIKRSNGVHGLERHKLHIQGLTSRPGYLVHIPQPCFRTLELLDDLRESLMQAGGYSISRVDIALDFLATDRWAADYLHRYLVARMSPRKMRSESAPWVFKNARRERFCFPPPGWYDDEIPFGVTSYLGFANERGAKVAIYSTRATKLDNSTPCTHLEWRTMGAEAVRAAGLDSPDALRRLDHRAFWGQRVRLLTGNASRNSGRLASWNSLTPIANLQTTTSWQQLSHQWMLPARENTLWDATWCRLHTRGTRIIRAANQFKYRTLLLGDAYENLY